MPNLFLMSDWLDDRPIGRRGFLRSLLSGAGATTLSRAVIARFPERAGLVIGVLTPAGARSPEAVGMMNGVELGIAEAQRASALFQRSLRVIRRTYNPLTPVPAAAAILREQIDVLIGGETEQEVRDISKACMINEVVFINPTSRSDSLRRASCSHFVFHVEASDAMYESAKVVAPGSITLWHPSLTRYGAAQLNDRYQARFKVPMNGSAWAGWMSVKVSWEAAMRALVPGSKAIAAQLAKADSHFDGHKGAPLSFRTWDHQLRQPLYSVTPVTGPGSTEPKVTDVPDLSRSSRSARDLLDTLGDKTSAHPCETSA